MFTRVPDNTNEVFTLVRCFNAKSNNIAIEEQRTTLYTLIPICLESFKAGQFTFLVSQARKTPIAKSSPLQAYKEAVHVPMCSQLQTHTKCLTLISSFGINTLKIIQQELILYEKNFFRGYSTRQWQGRIQGRFIRRGYKFTVPHQYVFWQTLFHPIAKVHVFV